MRRVERGGREGIAIVFVLLVMLAVFALAHGILVAALEERSASRAGARVLKARAAAEAGLQRSLAIGVGPGLDTIPTWAGVAIVSDTAGGAENGGRLIRIGPESWLVEGSGRVGSGTSARVARLAWSLDPLARIAALEGVVTVADGAAVVGASAVDATAPVDPASAAQPADCARWADRLGDRYTSEPMVPVAFRTDTLPPSLGPLPFEALTSSIEVEVTGTGTPEPEELLGSCVADAPWSWGDPDRSWRPCGGVWPARVAPGDLVVAGGSGQALLAVGGDLTVRDGARLHGLLLVRGRLRLIGASRLQGMAIATGGIEVEAGSEILGSACDAASAVAAQGSVLGGLRTIDRVGRVGPF